MRAMTAPGYSPQEVYQVCINSVSDLNLRSRLNAVVANIGHAADEYLQKGPISELHTIASSECDNDTIVVGEVTKKELKDVYSAHMVPRTKPARTIYDSIVARAPLGRCPFCGFGHATTLDHYLPKSKYPKLSVLPLNLVPSCKDCNSGKLARTPSTQEEQSLHPYFDHANYVEEQWLFARVVHTEPVTLNFFVSPPDDWSDSSKARVHAHFDEFKLAARYAVESSSQLACLRDTLAMHREQNGVDSVRQHLEFEAQSNYRQHRNSWQTAMFQGLANSDWYCNGGFI
ncbi:hypothetical protein [Microbulbifer magnicolonia]|uniref:HNH endonuclease n=1 Tax=Microbulbifer magnicolonia TaxID=3109744 RepID=UPI002B40B375|nr:hypothetical protein [Microbulbifer sp. GG15]